MSVNPITIMEERLPVFRGQSIDDHVEAWREVESGIEGDLWRLASIAASICDEAQYGAGDVADFAAQVSCARWRIYRLASTYRIFGKSKRFDNLSFEHYAIAACAPEPHEAIRRAVKDNLASRDLKLWISVQKSKGTSVVSINSKRQHRADEAVEKLQQWCEVFPEFAHHQSPIISIIARDANSTPATDRERVVTAIKNGCSKVYEIQEYTDNMLSVSRIHHAIDYLIAEKVICERAPMVREGNRHNKEREYYLV
ncbi:MAG: hypothetical protein QOH63_1967 [Acidobacteriota bacterium]|jgi:hypothetical protein|nr:hypothetical protein [Acidobacteriota bacterium]